MKRKSFLFLLSFIFVLFLGYKLVHIYKEPTCLEPATCIFCHKTKGESLGHDFTAATCTDPEICQRCQEIGNPALGHNFDQLTSTYSICSRCLKDFGNLQECLVDGNYLVYSLNFDKILCAKNNEEKFACASLTKLVTVPIALRYLELDKNITIGDELSFLKPHSSTAGLVKNDILTVKQLVEACLIPSGNDAAYVLAYHTALAINQDLKPNEAIDYFVQLMNEYVLEIGCFNSLFCSPDGLDYDTQYTCCNDLLKIAKKALENDFIKETCQNSKIREVSKKGLVYIWENSNKFLRKDTNYYNSNIIGLKTGTTPLAGNCIISVLDKANLEYIIISLNNETDQDRYQNVIDLINYLN